MSTYRVRASSWAELLDCPLRWQKKHLEGLRTPSTPPAEIGTAVHASTAAFDQSRLEGGNLTANDTIDIALDSIRKPREEVDWRGASVEKAEETAIRVHLAYCKEVAPFEEYTLVEHTLAPFVIDMGRGVEIEITGTLDRIRKVGDKYGVADVKTGGRAVASDGSVVVGKHAAQLACYTLLAEQELGLELELNPSIIGLQTVGQAQAAIEPVKNTREAMIGTNGQAGLLDFAAMFFRTGLFPPNPGSWLCSKKFCPHYENCKFNG